MQVAYDCVVIVGDTVVDTGLTVVVVVVDVVGAEICNLHKGTHHKKRVEISTLGGGRTGSFSTFFFKTKIIIIRCG